MAGYSALFVVLLGLLTSVRSSEYDGLDDSSEAESSLSVLKTSSRENKKREVIFRLYTKGSGNHPELCNNYGKITYKTLSLQKPIKIIINGWKGHSNSTFYQLMINGFQTYKDVNLITVDWSGHGSRTLFYPSARENVPLVATIVANFIDKLHNQFSVNLDNVHVIGHSLGAHIAGIAGYLVTTSKIGRITGLDPAYPLFSSKKPRERLSLDSAKFVDVIHTSSNLKGFGIPIGHADFYPNGPYMFQPGCKFDVTGKCSHKRPILFYVESLSRPRAFLAVPCQDWIHFQRKQCDINGAVPMGELTPRTAKGSYFLATNTQSPFGKGTVWS